MPEWNERPPYSTEQFLSEALEQHAQVESHEQDQNNRQIWRVRRKNMEPITFYFHAVYVLGLADYEAIRHAHPEIRCLVTTGNWNRFSPEAVAAAEAAGVALFYPRGLLGALYKDGNAFHRHRPKE